MSPKIDDYDPRPGRHYYDQPAIVAVEEEYILEPSVLEDQIVSFIYSINQRSIACFISSLALLLITNKLIPVPYHELYHFRLLSIAAPLIFLSLRDERAYSISGGIYFIAKQVGTLGGYMFLLNLVLSVDLIEFDIFPHLLCFQLVTPPTLDSLSYLKNKISHLFH